jgi:hypothetical protein
MILLLSFSCRWRPQATPGVWVAELQRFVVADACSPFDYHAAPPRNVGRAQTAPIRAQ